MNKKIISLCMILFIMIICTTVSAQQNDTNTTIDNQTDTTTITTTEHIAQQTIAKTASKSNDASTSASTATKIKQSESNDNLQDVQVIDEDNKLIIKKNNSSINVKTDTIQTSTVLNITGIVTSAYDKTNDIYAGGEEDGFTVNGATIKLYNESTGKIIANTTSGTDGTYQFTNLTVGNYTIEFNYGTYATGEDTISLTNQSIAYDYIFVPDITFITFSGDNSGGGQSDKIAQLKKISDRFLFLESYELNSSYDNSGQWMLDYSNFIVVDMYSIGNGFGIDTDLIAYSPASKNDMIAYVFGVYDLSTIQGTLSNWGFLGGNPHSVENTYIGSYWQTSSESNSTVLQSNMQHLYDYITYLLDETDVDPTKNGNGPLLVTSSWGVYYPGFTGNVKTPSEKLINQWISQDPGYDYDGAGSLNWMTVEYANWNLENNDPKVILRNFEQWYTKNNPKYNGSFIVISTYYEGGKVVDALIKEYEKLGRAVFSIYKTTSEDPDMTALLEIAGNKTVLTRGVSAVSYMYWWTTGYSQRGTDYTINAYKNLNVSLINALKDISKFSYESEYGPQNEWTAAVTMPEFEGVFGSIPVSYLDDSKQTVIIEDGIRKHAQLTNNWAKLRELNNSEKKISLLVYGYPPGKANIGASYLDVFKSIHDLLEQLYDQGYNIGMNKTEIPTVEEINNIVTDFGNKGLWAEGLIDSYVITHYEQLTENGQLVNQDIYGKWYDALPKQLQQDLDDYWGEGLGNGSMIYREKSQIDIQEFEDWLSRFSEDYRVLFSHYWNLSKDDIIITQDDSVMVVNKTNFYKWVYDLPVDIQKIFNQSIGFALLDDSNYKNEGYFLIPGVFFGNVFLSVQPLRGWESQIDFHNSYLPPPQQYIAYYRYLSRIFQTNAIIHLGTHGTLEWLPGRNLGLQSSDWPFQLIETPIIYPYIVSNPGEGMVAKERSFAQVITHLTPVTATTSLYGDYVELSDAISRYDTSKTSGVLDNIAYYKEYILNLTENLGYDQPDYVTVNNTLSNYYIAVANEDEKAINDSKEKLIQKAEIIGYDAPEEGEFDSWLEEVVKYINSDDAFDKWLSVIHANLEAMSADKINTGMHTLGEIWNGTDLITGVTSIVSSRTSVLDDIMHLYYPDITESYFDKIKDRDFDDKRNMITNILTSIVTSLAEGSTVEDVANSYGIFNNTTDLYQDLVEINTTINDILNNLEWYSIITALNGGYVEPGLAADPLYSDVLPTGRAMYVGDTTKIPSKSAWQSAVNSIDDVLVKYMVNLGEESFPELIGEVIWGTEALRTEGISLAQFMYLLGVKPVWDKTGTVTGVEVIPLENLTVTIDSTVYQRPRIDVFSTLVCNNPYWLGLLTQSVELVNSLNESTTDNYVKKHYAETGSLERLFGLPGAVLEGTGVSDLLNSKGTTLDQASGIADELASVYESRIGHSWNVDSEGNIVVKDDGESFAYLLEHVNLVIQDLDSTWRYLDSDDYLDWFGGLVNAATVHGTIVNTVLLDIRDKNTVVTSTLGEEVKKETRTTILNPQWLADMTDEVGGWNQMSTNFENLMKTMLTTQNYKENQEGKAILDTSEGNNAGIVGDGLLRETAKTVTYSEYFNINAQYKSYAFQSMAGWLLTADMAGYWKTNDNTLRKDLLQKYVDNANRYGVACCHHTCGNINFHEWVMKVGTALGVKGLSEYSVQYASATKNPNAASTEYTSGTPTPSTDGTGNVDISEGIGEYANNGATGEANAMAMAAQGAQGLADSASSSGSSTVMAAGSNFGTGTSDSGSSGGNGGGVGTGNGTGNGEGSGDGNDTANSGNSTGNGNGTSDGQTNQTAEDGQNTTEDANGSSTNQQNSTSDQNSTNSLVNQNTTQSDGSDSIAGEEPETDPSSVDTSSSEVAVAGSSSAGGSSGESAGSPSVYELVKKNIGTPPSAQSEIAFGYLLFIVVILVIFFVGFTRPNSRYK